MAKTHSLCLCHILKLSAEPRPNAFRAQAKHTGSLRHDPPNRISKLTPDGNSTGAQPDLFRTGVHETVGKFALDTEPSKPSRGRKDVTQYTLQLRFTAFT